MMIWQRLDELNMSRYQLSKASGLPWTEISDICNGKKLWSQCDAETLARLAQALRLSAETLPELETGPLEELSYLENDLTDSLRKSIDGYFHDEQVTIWQRLDELNMSRYQLSKASGLSWTEISDICNGKKLWSQCDGETLSKLAQALGLSIKVLLKLKTGPLERQSYQEIGLPDFLQKSIDNCIQGELTQVSHLDCLYDDLYGSINSAQWGGHITKEQADYLRKKYLFDESQEEEI